MNVHKNARLTWHTRRHIVKRWQAGETPLSIARAVGHAITYTSSPNLSAFLPLAKIGNSNFLHIWTDNSYNYFGLSVSVNLQDTFSSIPGLSVQQAYNIDIKIDDGSPHTGNITARYIDWNLLNYNPSWASGGGVEGTSPGGTQLATSTTCYDNNGGTESAMQYSVSQAGGTGINCALSFKFP